MTPHRYRPQPLYSPL